MLGTAIFFGLAATVLSATTGYNEQHIRIGNVGDSLTYLNGLLVPVAGVSEDDAPTYEFRSTVNGAPVAEENHYFYRCGIIQDYYTPSVRNQKPALLCHNVDYKKEDGSTVVSPKAIFILSADQLDLPPHVKEINLLFGKSSYDNFMAANPSLSFGFPYGARPEAKSRAVVRPYDGYSVVTSNHPYYSIMEHSSAFPSIKGSEQHEIQAAVVPSAPVYS